MSRFNVLTVGLREDTQREVVKWVKRIYPQHRCFHVKSWEDAELPLRALIIDLCFVDQQNNPSAVAHLAPSCKTTLLWGLSGAQSGADQQPGSQLQKVFSRQDFGEQFKLALKELKKTGQLPMDNCRQEKVGLVSDAGEFDHYARLLPQQHA